MKYLVLLLILIGFTGVIIHQAFSASDNFFYGTTALERIPVTISPNSTTQFEIKFQYTEGAYSLSNVTAIADITPRGATSKVHFDTEPVNVNQNSIVRIPVTVTVDPDIEYDKIFLNISYVGVGLHDVPLKSFWSDSIIFGIDHEIRNENIPTLINKEKLILSPLKQSKSGIQPDEITCKEGLEIVIKRDHTHRPMCVKPESKAKLIERGFAMLLMIAGPTDAGIIPKQSESVPKDTSEKTWVETYPIQCLGNPWEKDWVQSHDGNYSSYPIGEHAEGIIYEEKIAIENYYKKQGITVFDVRTSSVGENVVLCASCSCSARYTLYLLVSESDVDKMLNLNYKISQEEALKHVDDKIRWTFKPYEYWQEGKHDMTCEGMHCGNGYRDLKCGIEKFGFGKYGFLIKDDDSIVTPKERGILYGNATIDYSLCKLNESTFTLDVGKNGTFQIPYFIEGAKLSNIISNVDTNSIVITLDKSEAGQLTIALPKTLVDAIIGQCDKNYNKNYDETSMPLFVIVDGEEVNFHETMTTDKQIVLIQFQENAKKIEIIRACLI